MLTSQLFAAKKEIEKLKDSAISKNNNNNNDNNANTRKSNKNVAENNTNNVAAKEVDDDVCPPTDADKNLIGLACFVIFSVFHFNFVERFKLPATERQISVHGCSLNNAHGFAYCTKNYICFGKFFLCEF